MYTPTITGHKKLGGSYFPSFGKRLSSIIWRKGKTKWGGGGRDMEHFFSIKTGERNISAERSVREIDGQHRV